MVVRVIWSFSSPSNEKWVAHATDVSGEDGDGWGQGKSMLMVRAQQSEPRSVSILLEGRKRQSFLASPY
jgi:hypothetical protein